MSEKRKCKICGTPEQFICGGLYSTLSPFGEICIDCINKELDKKQEDERHQQS